MLNGADLQNALASESYGDNCSVLGERGDLIVRNLEACQSDLKECATIAIKAVN